MKYKIKKMTSGSMPNDNNYLSKFSKQEMNDFIKKEPKSKEFFKQIIGGREFLYNTKRYCLWLKDCSPKQLKEMPLVVEQIKKVKDYRLKSSSKNTRDVFSEIPSLFVSERQPDCEYLTIPQTTSEKRDYIPLAFTNKNIIALNSVFVFPQATLLDFAFLTSRLHNVWTKRVAGKLETRISYSNTLCYNTFSFPEHIDDKQVIKIKKIAQLILDIRNKYEDSNLAELYDPLLMPKDLLKAHKTLDKLIDHLYNKNGFENDEERLDILFNLYIKYTK